MHNIVLDMETYDPDDFITLLFLLGRADVNLKAVTITPGTPYQIGLIREALTWFLRDIPIGVYNQQYPDICVLDWHYNIYGRVPQSNDAMQGSEVLIQYCDENTTLITGAPLHNLGNAIKRDKERGGGLFHVGRWIAQGGFAGEGIVPHEKQLPKFRGMVTYPTHNLNEDANSTHLALYFEGIKERRFVSKNVCANVYYDADLHEKVGFIKNLNKSFELIWKGMEYYIKKYHKRKRFSDPLAACCAIDDTIGTWAEVELYQKRGEWGSRLCPGSNTWVIIDYNRDKFIRTFLEC